MPDQPGKHTTFYELLEAQSLAGCPICRLAHKATRRYLDSILYEAVLDPDVRMKLKSSRGFCSQHVQMLTHMPGRALGIALIYRDIIRATLTAADAAAPNAPASFVTRLFHRARRTRADTGRLIPQQQCPACAIGATAESDFTTVLLAHLSDGELYQAYSEGEGLCLPHLMQSIAQADTTETLQHLLRPQLQRYQAMLGDLDEFIRKRDHRYRGEEYGDEGDVWLRAMNAVVGGAGLGLSARSGGRRDASIDDDRRK